MKPGLSMLRRTARRFKGTPLTIVGRASEITLSCAVRLSRWIAARTTTVPRSNGPATARVTTDRPNGAPLKGPVKYTLPSVMKNGFGPVPAPTVALPINEPSPHEPAFAADSAHCSAFLIRPNRPSGDSTVSDFNNSSPSFRSSETSNGVLVPATGLCTPASNVGVNLEAGHAAPLPSPESEKLLWVFTILSLHDSSSTLVVCVPHLRGDVNGARGPLLKCNRNVENGNCGNSSNTVVN